MKPSRANKPAAELKETMLAAPVKEATGAAVAFVGDEPFTGAVGITGEPVDWAAGEPGPEVKMVTTEDCGFCDPSVVELDFPSRIVTTEVSGFTGCGVDMLFSPLAFGV